MNENYLKMGPHDVGGEDSLPIDTTDNNMTHWEKYANALRIVVSSKRSSRAAGFNSWYVDGKVERQSW